MVPALELTTALLELGSHDRNESVKVEVLAKTCACSVATTIEAESQRIHFEWGVEQSPVCLLASTNVSSVPNPPEKGCNQHVNESLVLTADFELFGDSNHASMPGVSAAYPVSAVCPVVTYGAVVPALAPFRDVAVSVDPRAYFLTLSAVSAVAAGLRMFLAAGLTSGLEKNAVVVAGV